MRDDPLIELAPSILSADFAHLADQIQAVVEGGATVLHVDVMDGHFVPNITIGPPVVASVRKVTSLPLDVHLMIENPERFVTGFVQAGANSVSVHYEAARHLDGVLGMIRKAAVMMITPNGTLTKNTARQPSPARSSATKRPPSRKPAAPASPSTMP